MLRKRGYMVIQKFLIAGIDQVRKVREGITYSSIIYS